MIASPTWLGPVLVWSQQNFQMLPKAMRCFKFLRVCSCDHLQSKKGAKINGKLQYMCMYLDSYLGDADTKFIPR